MRPGHFLGMHDAYQVLTAEVKGERIPRIDLADPAKSLLLLKPTGATAHGGGKRFDTESDDYNMILEWIRSREISSKDAYIFDGVTRACGRRQGQH